MLKKNATAFYVSIQKILGEVAASVLYDIHRVWEIPPMLAADEAHEKAEYVYTPPTKSTDPLVNVYSLRTGESPCYSWVNQLFRLGHFPELFVSVYHAHGLQMEFHTLN